MSTSDINNKELVDKKISNSESSVYAYDVALVEDLKARFKKSKNDVQGSKINDTVPIGPAQNMFDIIGSMNQDQVIMPFVSLERLNWQLNLDRQAYQTFNGGIVFSGQDADGNKIDKRAQIIPISVNWKLSVWTRDRLTNDCIMRELIFYYSLRPSLLVKIGHGLNMMHKFNIYFNSDIEDNSDIANHDINGTYFRQDVTLYTDDAYLWRANWQHTVAITPEINFNYGINES